MMIEVIQQLRFLHKFGVHNDIKPGNVMKRDPNTNLPRGDDITISPDGEDFQYKVIDYGGVATKRRGRFFFSRWVWSPRFAVQPLHGKEKDGSPQLTSFKYDFYELIVTAKVLQCYRTGEKQIKDKKTGKMTHDPYRKGHTGLLKELWEYVDTFDESLGPQPEQYVNFIRICMKGAREKFSLLPEYKKALRK